MYITNARDTKICIHIETIAILLPVRLLSEISTFSTSVTFILTSLNFAETEDTLALKENCVSHINPLILTKDKVI